MGNRSDIRYDNVIWDFNGTLIDDTEMATRCVNALLGRRGLPRLTTEAYRRVFGFPISDYYVRIGIDMAVEDPAALADEFHAEYVAGLPGVRLHSGVESILGRAEELGCSQYILSAMAEELLIPELDRLGIASRFEAIYGLGTRFAHSKIDRGRELVEAFGLRGQRSLMIGDTDHDAEVGEVLGFDVVLVAQGHQTAERLRATNHTVCERFADLADILCQ